MAHGGDRFDSFRETVREVASKLAGPWNGATLNEAAVRQAIALRFLLAAGHDIWNPLEVIPEDPSPGGKKADLAVRVGSPSPAFIVELKRLNAPVADKETEQTVNYASSRAIYWALATNGRLWRVFDISLFKPAIERNVLDIELTLDNTEEFASDLFDLLNRDRWSAGDIRAAVDAIRERQERRLERSKTLAKLLPRLDAAIASSPVEDSVEGRLLVLRMLRLEAEITEDEANLVREYLGAQRLGGVPGPKLALSNSSFANGIGGSSSFTPAAVNQYSERFHNYVDDGSSAFRAIWAGEDLRSANWTNLYSAVVDCALACGVDLTKCPDVYLSDESGRRRGGTGELLQNRQMSDGQFLHTHLSAVAKVKRLRQVLSSAGIQPGTLHVSYQGEEYDMP